VVQRWGGKADWEMRLLSAFVSGGAILALEPLFDVFLADGNRIEIIFGIDRNGTDRNAISHLYALSKAYPGQAMVHLFNAPARSSIFHPKLYTLRTPNAFCGVIGSSNLTLSGLGSNLESLLLFQDVKTDGFLATEMTSIWQSFAEPTSPLNKSFLRELTPDLHSQLLKKVPRRTSEERNDRASELWQPLSRVHLPRTRKPVGRNPIPQSAQAYMVYDIMKETRLTQMQIPLSVVENFFGIRRDAPAELEVSIITANSLSQPIVRPLVISGDEDGRRLMRRLEMPTIRHLERPLTVVFVKLKSPASFAYVLCPRGTNQHREMNSILDAHGQQGAGVRRYYIGRPKDELWDRVNKIIGEV
jgi:HKD family nuclease